MLNLLSHWTSLEVTVYTIYSNDLHNGLDHDFSSIRLITFAHRDIALKLMLSQHYVFFPPRCFGVPDDGQGERKPRGL